MLESKLAATAAFFIPLYSNFPLISAIAACIVGQLIKLFIFWYKESQWSFKKLYGTGGMPSSHSAIATALALAIGLQDGLGGPPFATALVTAFVVIRDGISARSQAQPEEQAEVVNQTESELPTEPLLAQSTPQHAFLGRPWLEVCVCGFRYNNNKQRFGA
nr:Acid phosphatase/vanadium-dependent haloperoxidase-related protein [Ipomoea batatas]